MYSIELAEATRVFEPVRPGNKLLRRTSETCPAGKLVEGSLSVMTYDHVNKLAIERSDGRYLLIEECCAPMSYEEQLTLFEVANWHPSISTKSRRKAICSLATSLLLARGKWKNGQTLVSVFIEFTDRVAGTRVALQ